MRQFEILVKTLDREFFGPSYNGQGLLPLLSSLDFETVMDDGTYEGYRVVEIALHVAYWKYALVKFLGSDDECDSPPFPEANFPAVKTDFNENDWRLLLAWMQAVHSLASRGVLAITEDMMDREMPGLGCTLEEFLVWFATHDSYHVAQIRNMGLPSLKTAREPAGP
jgi:hypothetical protein